MSKKKKSTVAELMSGLREEGYNVRINHIRLFNNVIVYVGEGKATPFLTRGEFQKFVDEGNLIYIKDQFPDSPPRYCDVVSTVGGWTRVSIEKDGTLMTFGKKNFGKNENFFRRKGVDGAFKMAYNALCRTLKDSVQELAQNTQDTNQD